MEDGGKYAESPQARIERLAKERADATPLAHPLDAVVAGMRGISVAHLREEKARVIEAIARQEARDLRWGKAALSAAGGSIGGGVLATLWWNDWRYAVTGLVVAFLSFVIFATTRRAP